MGDFQRHFTLGMLSDGLDIKMISKYTGLSESEDQET